MFGIVGQRNSEVRNNEFSDSGKSLKGFDSGCGLFGDAVVVGLSVALDVCGVGADGFTEAHFRRIAGLEVRVLTVI